MQRLSRALWCSVFAALSACRDPVFHCESAGREDLPRQCHTSAELCEKEAPSCFEQPNAHCFRTYASYKHVYHCAPSPKECEAARRKHAAELYSAAAETCKVVTPAQVENQ
ncbi:MAG TPA: hypothetical protein VM686_36765 [Polyangiaceae bacterium]|jgi:hypothetical protein|nr:hypothetical protein [Polyangiaceae bacterium]